MLARVGWLLGEIPARLGTARRPYRRSTCWCGRQRSVAKADAAGFVRGFEGFPGPERLFGAHTRGNGRPLDGMARMQVKCVRLSSCAS